MQNENDVVPNRLTPWQITYLLREKLSFLKKAGHYVGGGEDLRCLLPELTLAKPGDEAFILIRPYIHSMSLYLRVMPDNTILAFLGDSQGWHWRYYPTRDIVRALADYFPNIRIVLSNTELQPRSYQTGCVVFSIETLCHCAEHGEILAQELMSLPTTVIESADARNLPVICLEKNAVPESLKQALEKAFKTQLNASKTIQPDVINNALKSYQSQCSAISLDQKPSDYLKNIFEWQGLKSNHILPAVMAAPVYSLQMLAPHTLQLKFVDADRFYYGNAILWTNNEFPSQKNLAGFHSILRDYPGLDVSINEKDLSVTFTAKDQSTLRRAFDSLTQEKTQWDLLQKGHNQLEALSIFGEEAKEVLDIAQIQQNNNYGGLGIDRVNAALKYFLSDRSDIFVLTDHYSVDDQEKQLPDMIAKAQMGQIRYVVFSYAINEIHQVAVMIDHEQKKIIQINSQDNKDLRELIKLLSSTFRDYHFEAVEPSAFQEQPWSCGVEVVFNVVHFFKQSSFSIAGENITPATRKILRAATQQGLISYQQKSQEMREDNVIKVLLPLLNQSSVDWMKSLHQTLLFSMEQPGFSLKNFIGKLQGISSQFFQMIFVLTQLPNLQQDDKVLLAVLEKLLKTVSNKRGMFSVQEGNLIQELDRAIADALDDMLSQHEKQKLLMQSLEAYLTQSIIPPYLESYLNYFIDKYPKEHIEFYLVYSFTKALIDFEQAQIKLNLRLKAELQQRKERAEQLASAIEKQITAITSKASEDTIIFADFFKKRPAALRAFTTDEWAKLLEHLPRDPKTLEEIFNDTQTLLNEKPELSRQQALMSVLIKLRFDKAVLALIPENSSVTAELYKTLELTFKEERLGLVKYYEHYILQDDVYLAKIVYLLPSNEKLDFILTQKHKIKQAEIFIVITKILFVSLEEKLLGNRNAANFPMQSIMSILTDLICFNFSIKRHEISLDKFSELTSRLILRDDFLTLLTAQKDNIKDLDTVIGMMTFIPKDKKLLFVKEHSDKITDIKSLVDMLYYLSVDELLIFLKEHSDKIVSAMDVCTVLLSLPGTIQLNFIREHKDKLKDLRIPILIYSLDSNLQLEVAQEFADGIKSTDELVEIIKMLSDDKKLIFAQHQAHKINNAQDLIAVVAALPSFNDKLTLIREQQHKISNANELVALFELFRSYNNHQEVLRIMNVFDARVSNENWIVTCAMAELFYGYRFDLAQRYKDKLVDSDQIVKIIALLQEDERFSFALEVAKNFDEASIMAIVDLFSPSEKVAFLRSAKDKIKSNAVLSQIPALILDQSLVDIILGSELFVGGWARNVANIFIEMMLVDSAYTSNDITLVNIAELILSDNFSTLLNAQRHKIGEAEILVFMLLLPANERLSFVQALSHIIQNGSELAVVIKNIPWGQQLAFAEEQINKVHNGSELYQVALVLPGEVQHNFIMANKHKIKTVSELADLLRLFPRSKRLELVEGHEDKIKNGSDLYKIADFISLSQQSDFIHQHKNKIQNGTELLLISELLPLGEFNSLLLSLGHVIQNFEELREIARKLPNEIRLDFLMAVDQKDKITNVNDLTNILSVLYPKDWIKYVLSQKDKIKNGSELYLLIRDFRRTRVAFNVLDLLSPCVDKVQNVQELVYLAEEIDDQNDRYKFVVTCGDKIQSGAQLAKVVSIFPVSMETRLINQYRDRIKQAEDVYEIARILQSDARLAFLKSERDKFKSPTDFHLIAQFIFGDCKVDEAQEIVEYMLNGRSLELANKRKDSIEHETELLQLTKIIAKKERLSFLQNQAHKIKSSEILLKVTELLPKNERWDFTKSQIERLQDENYLIVVMKLIPEEEYDDDSNERVYFASKYKKLIKTFDILKSITELLPPKSRFHFLKDQQHIITDAEILSKILPLLDEDIRFNFVQRYYKDKIDSVFAITQVIQCLPAPDKLLKEHAGLIRNGYQLAEILAAYPHQKERIALAHLLEDKIFNGYQLAKVIAVLPIDDRSLFADFYQYLRCIKNTHELCAILAVLDEAERPELARDFKHKIKSGVELANVLKEFHQDARLNFAIECMSVINVNNNDEMTQVMNMLTNEQQRQFQAAIPPVSPMPQRPSFFKRVQAQFFHSRTPNSEREQSHQSSREYVANRH